MKKILVIEDNYQVRDNLCEILELSDYSVIAAKNGKIGVEKAVSETPDLIICDVMMPELDGFGVLKILNKNPKVNHIPLIFLTAKAEKSAFRKGMGLGADDYITKPFDDVELLEAIEMRLKKAERVSKLTENTEETLNQFFSEARAQQELEHLSENREIRHYRVKDMIYESGQHAHWLYFIISGQIKTYQSNDYGKDLITQIHSPGSYFGYDALILEEPYNHSAACMADTSVRLIPKDDFSTLLYSNRDFTIQFIKMLSNRTESVETTLLEMAYGSVRSKIAKALLTLSKQTDPKKKYIISASREDLASISGTAKETTIRTLSDFKSEGIITIDSRGIFIKDKQKLSNLLS